MRALSAAQAGLRRRTSAGRPDQHEGASRLLQQAQDPADGRLVRRRPGARSGPGIALQGIRAARRVRRAAGPRALQDVHRQAEVHRARRPAPAAAIEAVPTSPATSSGCRATCAQRVRGRARPTWSISWKAPCPARGQGGVSAEQQQGRLPGPGHGQGAQGVGVTGPRRDEGHSHLAGQAGPPVRHVHGPAPSCRVWTIPIPARSRAS